MSENYLSSFPFFDINSFSRWVSVLALKSLSENISSLEFFFLPGSYNSDGITQWAQHLLETSGSLIEQSWLEIS